jgi:hypothetical protein
MTDNLKIEALKQQLNDILDNSQLPLGIFNLIVQRFAQELDSLYRQTVKEEYEQYQKELKENNNQEEEKDE